MDQAFDGQRESTPLEHRPVLYQQIIHALQPVRGCFYLDATLGAGGHAVGLLLASSPDGRLLGLDLDPQALALARTRLAPFGERAVIRQSSYAVLGQQLADLGWGQVHGVLFDLGVSSMQLDTPGRGFSFQADAPLDMRFDPSNPLSAADLVNELPEAELAHLIYQYGEEPQARRIAAAIARARPVEGTLQLAEIVVHSVGWRSGGRGGGKRSLRIHPATLTFQALRIAVNHELQALETALPQAVAALAPGGRLAVISFHSLEDRIVKQFMRHASQDCICPPRQPICTCGGRRATLLEVYRRPLRPDAAEIEVNPRARSARLRVAEKLERQPQVSDGR